MKKESEGQCCEEKMSIKNCCGKQHHHHHDGNNGAIYGLGVVGALFYFLQGASTLTAVLVGIGKAMFWPAFVLYKVLQLLGI